MAGNGVDSDLPSGDLRDRRFVITGAASGMGREIATLFAKRGASVALLDRDQPALEKAAEACGGIPVVCDVADEAAVRAAVGVAAVKLEGLDGLVNAAGVVARAPLGQTALADWNRTLAVNLTGTFLLCRECLPFMLSSGHGTIVNFSSGAALLPFAEIAAYSASKAGVIGLTKSLAAELGPRKIRVNAICPGHVDTPMIRNPDPVAHQASLEARSRQAALGRVAEPIEIARLALFLSCTDSSFITGSILSADGGRVYH